jgi:hypothetical protein
MITLDHISGLKEQMLKACDNGAKLEEIDELMGVIWEPCARQQLNARKTRVHNTAGS